jgi:type I restriction enzyme R subunit
MRRSVKIRYADSIDNSEYERQMQNLLDTHLTVAGLKQITNPVDILDRDGMEKELEELGTGTIRAKADAIRSTMAKSISECYDENPAYYESFSKRIQIVLEEYKNRVISDAEYLKKMASLLEDYRNGVTTISYPETIKGNLHAQAFYGVISGILKDIPHLPSEADTVTDITLAITEIIARNNYVDWQSNIDVHNRIANDIDELFYKYELNKNLRIDVDTIDKITENVKATALRRFR